MDINTMRSVVTVLTFIIFVGIMVWTFSRRNSKDFEAASKLPFEQD